jgi:hypothetical protein
MAGEALKRVTIYLEEEQLEAIAETARELSSQYGQRWSRGAVIRLALSQFLTQRGKFL